MTNVHGYNNYSMCLSNAWHKNLCMALCYDLTGQNERTLSVEICPLSLEHRHSVEQDCVLNARWMKWILHPSACKFLLELWGPVIRTGQDRVTEPDCDWLGPNCKVSYEPVCGGPGSGPNNIHRFKNCTKPVITGPNQSTVRYVNNYNLLYS